MLRVKAGNEAHKWTASGCTVSYHAYGDWKEKYPKNQRNLQGISLKKDELDIVWSPRCATLLPFVLLYFCPQAILHFFPFRF